ncbi:MAG: TIGR03936 family radical SAM-associated protein [Clostridia bacterium]|nr:TIGR03936 family radical SAM-associated protein [Clostridia bacterium]
MNAPIETGIAYRCRFEKCGPIRFISHLDLTRAFHRAFSRAEIPLKFSEGFSPHPKFSFALPLSVGTESTVELADFTLKAGFTATEEEIRDRLQAQMPAGIRILGIFPQGAKFSEIAFADYRVLLPGMRPEAIFAANRALEGELVVKKKNKKGKWVEKEISQGIRSIRFEETPEGVVMYATLSAAGEAYLKPETVLDVLAERLPEESFAQRRILRFGIYLSDMTPF